MGNDPLKEYKFKEKLELKNRKSFPQVRKVTCPSCSETVPGEHLNIQTNIAKCNGCDIIFSINEQVESLSQQNDILQEILQPAGVELTHFQDDLDISVAQHWTTLEIVPLAILPYLVFFLAVATSITLSEVFSSSLISIAGTITVFLVALFGYISYFSIRKKHKIYIHIDDQDLHIEWRPRKFIKDKKYAIRNIDQVYIKDIISGGTKVRTSIFMIVNGEKGQKHVELIKSVSSRTKAKYIEQEIEKHLGIKDRRVPDEKI